MSSKCFYASVMVLHEFCVRHRTDIHRKAASATFTAGTTSRLVGASCRPLNSKCEGPGQRRYVLCREGSPSPKQPSATSTRTIGCLSLFSCGQGRQCCSQAPCATANKVDDPTAVKYFPRCFGPGGYPSARSVSSTTLFKPHRPPFF